MRVGLFGGCFNPVHCGHVAAARAARDHLQLDRVVFIPSGQPPLKGAAGLMPGQDRLAMLRDALANEPGMSADGIELDRAGPSYTVDTVRVLRQGLPEAAELFFLLGSDCLDRLPRWKGIDELHAMLRFAIVQRRGAERVPDDRRIVSVPMAPCSLSSTLVRDRLARGESVVDLVPPAVVAYLARARLSREPVHE